MSAQSQVVSTNVSSAQVQKISPATLPVTPSHRLANSTRATTSSRLGIWIADRLVGQGNKSPFRFRN